MSRKRHTLLLALAALLLAGGAAAQTAPGFPELLDQAANTYEKGDWTRKGPVNPELERLYKEDQADRAPDMGKIDWSVVGKRDEERRKRVLEIIAQGGAKEAERAKWDVPPLARAKARVAAALSGVGPGRAAARSGLLVAS